jgi:hypothetical protein
MSFPLRKVMWVEEDLPNHGSSLEKTGFLVYQV